MVPQRPASDGARSLWILGTTCGELGHLYLPSSGRFCELPPAVSAQGDPGLVVQSMTLCLIGNGLRPMNAVDLSTDPVRPLPYFCQQSYHAACQPVCHPSSAAVCVFPWNAGCYLSGEHRWSQVSNHSLGVQCQHEQLHESYLCLVSGTEAQGSVHSQACGMAAHD